MAGPSVWINKQLQLHGQDINPPPERVTFTERLNNPISLAAPYISAPTSSEPISRQSVNLGTYDLEGTVNLDWEEAARSRAARFLDMSSNSSHRPSLDEVIRDRVWPFYSNWLHELLGPYTRTAEFDRNDDRDITSVTIYITCNHLPHPGLQQIIKNYTSYLVPDDFRRNDEVVVKIGQESSTRSTTIEEFLTANPGPVDLKMGDGVMSSVV